MNINNNRKESQKKYREKNKERLSQNAKKYREKNKGRLSQNGKEYREKNKEKLRDKSKKYREKNKDIINQKKRNNYKKNRAKLNKVRKDYILKNRLGIYKNNMERYYLKQVDRKKKIRNIIYSDRGAKLYLGRLCAQKHYYKNTMKSLRYVSCDRCLECVRYFYSKR